MATRISREFGVDIDIERRDATYRGPTQLESRARWLSDIAASDDVSWPKEAVKRALLATSRFLRAELRRPANLPR